LSGYPDKDLIQRIAAELAVDPSFVEKDWHAVRLVGLVASLDHETIRPVFSGGTSLSKGYGLIRRFSEDVDFKLTMPEEGVPRPERKAYRERVIEAINATDEWQVIEKPIVKDDRRFFGLLIEYERQFDVKSSLRPHLKLDVRFTAPATQPESRALRSFLAQAEDGKPEVPNMPCVSPVETAADKLSTLTWHLLARQRGGENDDVTFIRHLYDLAALESTTLEAAEFPNLLRNCLENDSGRGGSERGPGEQRVERALGMLAEDPEYPDEYRRYVLEMSYADEGEDPGFKDAVGAARRLTARLGD